MSDPDERSVESLIDAFGVALGARDLEGSMAQLDDDAGLVVIPSEGVDVYRGTGPVRSFLSRIYGGPRRYGWRLNDRTVAIDGNTAWFTALGDETVEEADAVRTIPYCLTGVAVRRAGGWRLRLLHASEDSTRAPVDTRTIT
jgi:ketosteroid isomerase-like protein